MPNWCDNVVTIQHDERSKIDAIVAGLEKEEKEFLNVIRPNPAGEWDYGWSVENWGTKWEAGITDWNREDDNTVWVSFDSAWSPPIAIYEFMNDEGYQVRAKYHEPGMAFAGSYEDGYDDFYEYDITDASNISAIPEDIIDFADLEYRHDEWVAEQEEERLNELERTDWFDAKTKPSYVGRYEVTTDQYDHPQYCNWDGNKWSRWEGDKVKVVQWRGLIENPENPKEETQE